MKIYISLLLLSFIYNGYAQSTAHLLFKKSDIELSETVGCSVSKIIDSMYIQTIVKMEQGKYFYFKQTIRDTLVVESGQLNLYVISGKNYLLRNGFWLLEDSLKKVLFGNLGKRNWLEEIKISQDQMQFGDFNKPEKTKKTRSVKSKNTKSN